jgi:hypothetical protein
MTIWLFLALSWALWERGMRFRERKHAKRREEELCDVYHRLTYNAEPRTAEVGVVNDLSS